MPERVSDRERVGTSLVMLKNEKSTAYATKKPLRLADIPHDELYRRARMSLALGSRERAKQDALTHVLTRRLEELRPGDHRQYIEIKCWEIVENLRAIRDEYRSYLEEVGCKPIAELYWVVFRFAILLYAVRLLREIAANYVIRSKVPFLQWEILFGHSFIPPLPPLGASPPESPKHPTADSVRKVIVGLVDEDALRRVWMGGPFGRDAQLMLTRRTPGFNFWGPEMTMLKIAQERKRLWGACSPWTRGLAQLFDSTQEELNYQYSLLAEDAKRKESAYADLSKVEKIAHEHLVDMRKNSASRNLSRSDWLKLLDGLDTSGINLESQLTQKATKVLAAVRRRGHSISNWKECYEYTSPVIMDDARKYSLRREVTHALHNAAKRARYKLARVWAHQCDSES